MRTIRYALLVTVLIPVSIAAAAVNTDDANGALWKVPFDAECRKSWSPVIAGNAVYVPSWHGLLHAFALETGELVWSFPEESGSTTKEPTIIRSTKGDLNSGLGTVLSGLTNPRPGQGVLGTPLIHEDELYVLAEDFKLYKFGATSRKLEWSFDAGGPIQDPALVQGETVHVVSGSRWGPQTLYALRSGDGSTRWTYEDGKPISRLTRNNNLLFFTTQRPPAEGEAVNKSTELTLRGFAADSGQEQWMSPTGMLRHDFKGPSASEDLIFFTTRRPNMVPAAEIVQNTADRKLRSRARRLMKQEGGEALLQVSSTVSIHALDASSGTRSWQLDLDAPLAGSSFSPPLPGKTIVVFATEVGVYAVDRISGKLRWRFDHRVSPGSLRLGPHGYLHVLQAGSRKNTIMALDLETGNVVWSAPFRENLWIRAVLGNVLYMSHGYDSRGLSALDSSNGQILWTIKTGKNEPCTGPIERDGRLIFGTGMEWTMGSEPVHGSLYSIDKETGGLD
jgi:outer membrane protein assembly factor BamB